MSENPRVSVTMGGALGMGGAISRRLAAGGDLAVAGHTIPVDGGTLAASGWFVRADFDCTNRPHRA